MARVRGGVPLPETDDQTYVDRRQIKRDMPKRGRWTACSAATSGYGKTELAMRAAFKAVEAGKQVAVLVPTTVLAEQHDRTFRERMADYPVRGRGRSAASRRRASSRTICAGGSRTGRSTSSSARTGCSARTCSSRDLGLVVIDEEQRFGVEHKERLKQHAARRWTC